MHLTNGFTGTEGMPASAKEGLELMEKAIKSDTEIVQHEAAVAKMKANERTIELNNMATQMADRQFARAVRSADYLNNIGYVCVRCKQHPHDCWC
jgi:hypothetical protein